MFHVKQQEKIMRKIFETHAAGKVRDFDTEAEARQEVEKHGIGFFVTFIRGFDGRDRSCAMETYSEGAWRQRDISI